jgi:glucokinase
MTSCVLDRIAAKELAARETLSPGRRPSCGRVPLHSWDNRSWIDFIPVLYILLAAPSVKSGMTNLSDPHFIGVDIGGTKVAAGLVDSAGEISHQARTPMVATDAAAGLAAVLSAIDSVRTAAGLTPPSIVSGIGICAPGPLDPRTGVVINPPNLPGWRNFPLGAEVTKTYRLPVKVDNDGNAAALAEALWGAGRGYRNVFYATIGTGIGTGIVFDGLIYHGRTGAAAEGGHVTIDYRGPRCKCGKLGCIEILASGTAIARRASEQIAAGRRSAILELAGGDRTRITGEMVGQAYAAGDLLAKELLQETAMFLTVWLGTIVDLLEPDVMIVGGGVASMLQPFFAEIHDRLPSWSVNSHCQEIPLLPAHYGSDAGIAGGAALCLDRSNQ